ncbi:SurA N-terminal domain-containing protein [Roseibium polysiphoniae]|uniref:Parvulin-like PPIase n=1 Tax=Roseibium polysiphoniae TaxID=2571221 RepID=A0ABR9CAI9_9HYPH|nr:SurA N-terminal domain-containing protein [Roseibium polysiphoniae]MBD8875901.1 SurA N-terminal domain-containing protein [Roseibium polysiphoniae]
MLDALRKGAGTWIAKLFIALLVMSFAVWGVADIFQGFGQNVAAKVGGTEISLFSFDRAYRRDLNNLGRQIGRPLSTVEGAQFGIPQQTLGKLVAEAAMNETATSMNLGVSDQKLATLIQADPAFQRPGGGYDRSQLAQVLRNNGMTEDEYVVERRQLAERQQLAEGLTGGMATPIAYLEALHSFEAETRDVSYLLLEPALLGEIEDPSETDLTAYFDAEKDNFKAPEYREIAILELSPTKLMRPDDIGEDAVAAEYDRNKDDYFQAERRDVRQMSFTNEDDAKAAAEKLAGGMTFDDLMAEQGLGANDVDLGLMAKADFLDEAIGDAAFSLAQGETSGVVEGRFSSVIVNVTDIEPESVKALEEVADEIREELAQDQAEREVLDLLDEIEDARAGGASLAEIASRFSLETITPAAFDAQGNDENETAVVLPEAAGLLAGAFDSDVGVENDPLQLGDRGFLWYEVTKVVPSRDRNLSEVRDRVVAAWKADEEEKRLTELATDLAERARTGADFASLAEELGADVKFVAGLARTGSDGDLGREAVVAAFAGPSGITAAAPASDGANRLVLKVDAVNSAAFFAEAQDVRQLRTQLSQQLQDSLLNQYVTDIEQKAGVEVNQASIAQVIGVGTN